MGFLKKVQAAKAKQPSESSRKNYLTSFSKFKQYLGAPSRKYKKLATDFEANKKPYKEYDEYDEKEYVRDHILGWDENVSNNLANLIFFDKSEHKDRVADYQKAKAEEANELDNKFFWIESSNVLTMFDDVKMLTELLTNLNFQDKLDQLILLMDSLTKSLVGNDAVQSYFYIPEGVDDFLYFLNYSFKNYY